MNVYLTPEIEKLVDAQMKSGGYDSRSELVRDALLLWGERDRLRQMRLKELHDKVEAGLDQLDRGERAPLDVEDIKAQGCRQLAKRRKGA